MATASPALSNNSTDTSSVAAVAGNTLTNISGGSNTSKNQRGLNKPKCIKCGNVARSRIDLEDIDLDKDASTAEKTDKDKKIRAIWSTEEDELLTVSFLTIRQNWRCITSYYNEHRPMGSVIRDGGKIRSRWHNRIRPSVYQFNAIYNKLHDEYRSGWSDHDLMRNAYKQFKDDTGKAFVYEHVWRIMKSSAFFGPQSDIHHSKKKARASGSEGHTSTNVDVNEIDARTRPIGQKAAKRKGKGKTITENVNLDNKHNDVMEKIVEYTTENVNLVSKHNDVMEKIVDYTTVKTAELEARRVELEARKVEAEARKVEAEARKVEAEARKVEAEATKAKVEFKQQQSFMEEVTLLKQDVSAMTPQARYIHECACNIIKKKWRDLGYSV